MATFARVRQPGRCARAATSPNPDIAPRSFPRLAISADKFQLNQPREQLPRSIDMAVQSKHGIDSAR
jgi:hypothetical protein